MNKTLITIIASVAVVGILSGAGFYIMSQDNDKNGSTTSLKENGWGNYVFDEKGEITDNGGACTVQYRNLLSAYERDFDDCRINISNPSDCEKQQGESLQKQKNVIIAFDASGSMAAMINGKRKIDIARNAINDFVKTIDAKTNVGVVVYGHKGGNRVSDKPVSCAGIEEIYPIGPVHVGAIESKLSTIKPTGWTPIANALEKARQIVGKLPREKNDNLIVLVSDGEETCGGDPVTKAKELFNSELGIITNIVGFDIGSAEEKKLRAISDAGKGKYFSARNEQELITALRENKNFMSGFDCYMKQSDVWLGNDLAINEKKSECLFRLDSEERHAIELSVDTESDGVTRSCKNYIVNEYGKRYNQLRSELESIFKKLEDESSSKKQQLESVTGSMDEEEEVFDPFSG